MRSQRQGFSLCLSNGSFIADEFKDPKSSTNPSVTDFVCSLINCSRV